MAPALQIDPALLLRAQGLRVVFFDVDGVLTDGGLYFGASGGGPHRHCTPPHPRGAAAPAQEPPPPPGAAGAARPPPAAPGPTPGGPPPPRWPREPLPAGVFDALEGLA